MRGGGATMAAGYSGGRRVGEGESLWQTGRVIGERCRPAAGSYDVISGVTMRVARDESGGYVDCDCGRSQRGHTCMGGKRLAKSRRGATVSRGTCQGVLLCFARGWGRNWG